MAPKPTTTDRIETDAGIAFDTDVWAHADFEIDANGHVDGSAYTHEFANGHDVVIGVTSYDYERAGETRTNHIPNAVTTDADGTIVHEGEPNDSENPQTAIENAKGSAEFIFENAEQFGLGGDGE